MANLLTCNNKTENNGADERGRLSASEFNDVVNSVNESHQRIDDLYDYVDSNQSNMSDRMANAELALDNAAIYPFGGIYPSVGSMPDDGRIGFITSLKRFAKNPDNASLGEYNTEDGKARTDCLFRDGNRLYRVGSDGLLEEYANSFLGATVENLGHEVVGIWDEINAVKELMTYRGRIEAALRKLDYDDADIETFFYLNTHFPDSDFTVPAIESDAENWIRWKSKYWEYNSGEMMDEAENNTMTYQLHRILPKYPKEWEEDVRKPSPEAFGKIICNTDRPLYIPLLETARAPWLMEHEYHSLNLYPHLSGGLIYHGDPIAIHSWGSLHAIGVVRGNFLRVNFGVNIKWVKEFTSYVPVSLHYALGGYLKDLRNFDFSNVTDAEDMIKPNQYLCPIQTPDTFNLHITPEHSFKRMFDNTTLSGVTFKISKTDSDFANNPWGVGNLLEKCVIDFNNNHLRSHTIYAKCGNGVSKFNCEGFVILRNYFHSTEDVICLSNYKNVNAGGRDGLWEVFAPQMSEALAAPSERDAGYILPIGWGLYQYCKPINYDGLLRQQVEVPGFDWEEGLNRSVNSLADRTRYESRTLTFSQWQFDLLTEETIANAVAKNYTITIN